MMKSGADMFKNKQTSKSIKRTWLVSLSLFPFKVSIKRYNPNLYVIHTGDPASLWKQEEDIKLAVTDEQWDKAMASLRYSQYARYAMDFKQNSASVINNID